MRYPFVLLWLALGQAWAKISYIAEEVVYTRAVDFKGDTVELKADLYLPHTLTTARKPILVLVHGGGFEIGSRKDSHIVFLARFFVERGFFVASIDYRLGLPKNWTAQDWIEANIRAVQDLRTFIRYLKFRAAYGELHGIDTTRIIVYGHSAGAFTALHAAFLTDISELAGLPYVDTARIQRMGGLYGAAYPEHTADFWMVVNSSGAIYDLNWVSPKKTPYLVCIHPLADSIVKPEVQRGHRGIIWYGSLMIDSVFRGRGGAAFTLVMDADYCHFPSISCHSWQGDMLHVSFGAPVVADYLYKVITPLLTGRVPSPSLQKYFFRPTVSGLAKGCIWRLLGGNPIRGECKALLATIVPSTWAFVVWGLLAMYLSMQLFLAALIRRNRFKPQSSPPYEPQLLVPFRNEAQHLPSLIESLEKQSLRLSVIWGDDGSVDESVSVVQANAKGHNRIVAVPANWHREYVGKHAVLAYLEQFVETEVFFVADADMKFPPKWAQTLYQVLHSDPKLGGVCGASLPRADNLWAAFQRIEHASFLYLIAASQRLGDIPTAIGNSMALRREAWQAIGGWRNLPPTLVEDYALMRAMIEKGWQFRWVFHPDAFGETRAEPTLKRWLQQRLRWRLAVQKLSPLAVGYWVLQSLLPWMMVTAGSWFSVACMMAVWSAAEMIPLWRFRWVVGTQKVLRYLPMLLLYRFAQAPWLLWLRFTRQPIHWHQRQYELTQIRKPPGTQPEGNQPGGLSAGL